MLGTDKTKRINQKIAKINIKSMEDNTMKNSKKNVVITGKMMIKAFMVVAQVATVVLMGLGIYTADSQLIGQVLAIYLI